MEKLFLPYLKGSTVSIFPISERILEDLFPITSYFTARTDDIWLKEIQIIVRLFLVITKYCQVSSSQFNQSLNL